MANAPNDEIVHRQIDTERETPVVAIAEIVSEIENVPHEELTTTYEHLDHILQELFSSPPVPEAQVEVSFTYEGYRIKVEQSGDVQLIRATTDNI
jgi:hypothetical protein